MCLFCKEGTQVKVALKDIKCYKVLLLTANEKLKAPYFKFFYEIGKLYEGATNIGMTTYQYAKPWDEDYREKHKAFFGNGFYHITRKTYGDSVYIRDSITNTEIPAYAIGQGFHSCKSFEACLNICNIAIKRRTFVIVECTIPRGSFYYIGSANHFINDDSYYASNALRIEKIIYKSNE